MNSETPENNRQNPIKFQTVDEYFSALSPEVRMKLAKVRQALRDALPDSQERISWGMPTFWKKHNLIHYAAMKKHIGIYPGSEAIETFSAELKPFEVSKGAICIPYSMELPLDLIARIGKWCMQQYGN